jgi:hypothetical protein
VNFAGRGSGTQLLRLDNECKVLLSLIKLEHNADTVFTMRKNILPSLILLMFLPSCILAQQEHESDIKHVAREMEARYRACPRMEVVALHKGKHGKLTWQKRAVGPPYDVFVDVKPSGSILYSYILTIEYSVSFAAGPERQSKADAESDTSLSPMDLIVPTIKHRNSYAIGKDGIRLMKREDPTIWEERLFLSKDACWNQIGVQ